MTKTLQILLDDEEHKLFKLWCTSKGKKMSEFMKEVIIKCVEGFDPDEVIKKLAEVDAYKIVELTTASGIRVQLPIPNLVETINGQVHITVPEDTAEEDIEFLGTIPNSLIKTNKDWRTELPLEIKT